MRSGISIATPPNGRATFRRCSSGTPTYRPSRSSMRRPSRREAIAARTSALRPPLELPLPRIQRWMQAVIEQPGAIDEAVESPAARAKLDPAEIDRVIRPSRCLTPVERVGVYQGMYLLRMVEA